MLTCGRINYCIPGYRILKFQKAWRSSKMKISPLDSNMQGMGRVESFHHDGYTQGTRKFVVKPFVR